MYCSSCGTRNPVGRDACEACHSPLGPGGAQAHAGGPRPAPAADRLPMCPRCGFQGTAATYFSRGSHVALLVGATVLTAGMMGAGGILYYVVRREHRICPRCGRGWGRFGERALRGTARRPAEALRGPLADREHPKRRWSVLLFVLAAVLAAAGAGAGEAGPLMLAIFAAAGAIAMRRSANRAREARRARLLTALQTPVLALAADRGGRLTVTQVAASLGWPLRRAERVLNSLDDGLRVDSEVTDEGVIVYEFRELLGRSGGGEPPGLSGD